MPPQLPLRPNVCMMVFNRHAQLFLGERAGKGGRWQFPQGGAEDDLSLEENVYRELREELGLKKKHIGRLIRLQATHEYDWDAPPSYAKGKWRGQAQTFWLVEFLGKDDDIDLFADKDPELMSWKWCSAQEVRESAEPKRVGGYEEPLQEFEVLRKKGILSPG